jgi:hypothetical protein
VAWAGRGWFVVRVCVCSVLVEGSEEQVEVIYGRFKAELQRLYYRHRPDWEHRDLEFVED